MVVPASSLFGSNVTIDETTPSDPKLVITLTDFQDDTNSGDITGGLGLDDATLITDANKDAYAADIMAAISILFRQQIPVDNTDETDGAYILFDSNFDRAIVTRNGVSQLRFDYTFQFFTPDTNLTLDPDNVV